MRFTVTAAKRKQPPLPLGESALCARVWRFSTRWHERRDGISWPSMKAPQDYMAKMASAEFEAVPLSDQFGNELQWRLFESMPRVLVFAGKEAAAAAKDWGILLQKTFNPLFHPTPQHLQRRAPDENIKVVAVATLPEVPSIFRGLFRSGFRRDAKDMGVALDFSRALSKQFSYEGSEELPLLVILPKGSRVKHSQILALQGLSSDAAVRNEVTKKISSFVRQ